MHQLKAEDVWPTVAPEDALAPSVKFLPLPDRGTLDEEERQILDELVARDERKFNSIPWLRENYTFKPTSIIGAMLQSPRMARLWTAFGDFYQTAQQRGTLTNRDREMAEMAMIALSKTPWQIGHITVAIGAGLAPSDIKAIFDGRLDELAPEDRQIVDCAQAIVREELDREMYERLANRLGAKTAMEFLGFVTWTAGRHLKDAALKQLQGLVRDHRAGEELLKACLEGSADTRAPDAAGKWTSSAKK